ncbi:uncharacterized protein LOC122665499 [Telopea speciosissima]|uniref:uncharacterized protein LOC122665499 n=1 Tax=Telopea speciosissima TaxID=54955 RepID=UPI001CC56991|nr:uncharacterized protein LOC122665499 [Telopea speciosissima]
MAELGAFFTGMKQAQELNIGKLWIESDSAALVSAVLNHSIPWCFMQNWWTISEYLDTIQWRITHCYREANSAADALANQVAKGRSSTFWDVTPSFVAQIVNGEALSRPHYRFT